VCMSVCVHECVRKSRVCYGVERHYYTAYTRSYLRYSAQEVNVTITGDVAALVAQLGRPAHLQRLQNATSEQFPPTNPGVSMTKRLAASIAATAGSSEQERKQTHLADSLAAVERGSATAEQR